ncbi:hypothetical protein JOD60_001346 [Microbacterium aurum]|nr:hypothetical protein [Microbacterium aurum]
MLTPAPDTHVPANAEKAPGGIRRGLLDGCGELGRPERRRLDPAAI